MAGMDSPWPSCTPSPSAAQASLRRLSASVAVASGLVASGRAIDLTGLDAVAGLLCAQVLDLDAAEGSAMRPAVAGLGQTVEALIETLKAAGR